jgi:hypothetical protein
VTPLEDSLPPIELIAIERVTIEQVRIERTPIELAVVERIPDPMPLSITPLLVQRLDLQ